MRTLVTGATGFVGGRLAGALAARGVEVRCLVRDRRRAEHLAEAGHALHEGDVLEASSLRGAGEGVSTAYYLVHSMGRGNERDGFADRERRAAENLARMAREEGVERVVYLGGLGDERSEHLKSRAATAATLAEHGPPLTYFRAAMVIGAGSESYRTVRYLVERLPAMIAPAWLRNRTQPIAIDDVLAYLVEATERPEAEGREVQIGGPDIMTYSEVLDLMAEVLGKRRRPQVPFPLLTPRLSALWIGLVTPVDTGVARPLIESLASETIVTDPEPAALFDVEPMGCMDALRLAREDEAQAE